MAKYRIQFKPDGSYVVRGTIMSGKQLVRQISLSATSRESVSDVMKEVAEALRPRALEETLAQDRTGEGRVGP